MANSIFMNIYLQKLREFVNIFSNDSESIFKAHGDTLIHPGEFGKYREETTKNILKMLLKKSYGIGDGFILTSKDTVSTQCDIVIYDNNTIPLIQENSVNFFPVETVVGIGEIIMVIHPVHLKHDLKIHITYIKKTVYWYIRILIDCFCYIRDLQILFCKSW